MENKKVELKKEIKEMNQKIKEKKQEIEKMRQRKREIRASEAWKNKQEGKGK